MQSWLQRRLGEMSVSLTSASLPSDRKRQRSAARAGEPIAGLLVFVSRRDRVRLSCCEPLVCVGAVPPRPSSEGTDRKTESQSGREETRVSADFSALSFRDATPESPERVFLDPCRLAAPSWTSQSRQ